MTNKILGGLFIISLLTNCNSPKTQVNQLNHTDDFNIIINSPDTIGVDKELFASFHITNNKYKLLWAHYDCNVADTTSVDTQRQRIIGCNNNLTIENDSVKVWLQTGPKVGKRKFQIVTLLAKDKENKFYFQNCTFDYYVK